MKKMRRIVPLAIWLCTVLPGCAATAHEPRASAGAAPGKQVSLPPQSPGATGGLSASAGPSTNDGTERTLQPDDLRALKWRSVGPANMSGRVADIAVAAGNPKTFFVAFGTGGLFKTTNNGTTFTAVFDDQATASIGSVVVANAPPDWPGWRDELGDELDGMEESELIEKGKAKIVWVGTGEGNNRNSSSWGNGVYLSTDGGGRFEPVGLADSHDIPRLAVHPDNPDVCYVAALGHLWGPNTMRGLYKTTDRGQTWKPVLQIDEDTGACDVIIDPQDPDTVYAAMYMRRRSLYSFRSGGPEGGIFRSDDGGAAWKKLTEGLPAQTGRIGMDIYAKDPRILYAVVESDVGGWGVNPYDNRSKSGGVFRTDDRGDTWTRVNKMTMRPFYFSKIRIDPTDDKKVYQLGWGLAVSDDGGRNFRAGGAKKPHVDMHALFINPDDPDHLIMGTDGGIYISYDRCATWDFLNHLAVGEFYNVAVDMSDPYRIGGGLQDNGSWIGPSATMKRVRSFGSDKSKDGITNHDWRFINGGDGFHVAFDPEDSNIIYAESQGGELVRIHLDTGRRTRLIPSPKEGQPRFRFNWNAPFFISPHDPTVLYLGGNYVFKMTDRGDRWRRISDDLSARDVDKILTVGSDAETHGTVVSLTESTLAQGMLWAGTDDGLVHLTTNDGETWTNVTPPDAGGLYISKIEASRHQRDTAYVAIDGHRSDDMSPRLLMTTDAGATWRSIVGDLPDDSPVKVVREDVGKPTDLNPWASNVLYVGTERAAYVTIDRGKHWTKLNGGTMPTVAVDDLVQHPRETDLVAGTHGRSIYVLDDASPLSQLTPEIVQSKFHLFDVRPAKPVLYLDDMGFWGERMFTAKNPPMGARITYWLRDYTSEKVSLSITNETGTKVRGLTGTQRPGFNRVVWDLLPEEHDRFPNPDSWLGQMPFVSAGEYTVKVTCGQHKATSKFTVLPAPGVDEP
ncbi:MAG: hypothetical protein V3W34_20515 [Phycisphaerae bacterium]